MVSIDDAHLQARSWTILHQDGRTVGAVDARPAAPRSVPPNADELAAAQRIDAWHHRELGFYGWSSLCISPWLALLGLALWHRSPARRAFDAVVRSGPIVPGRRELEGIVEPIEERAPIRVELSDDCSNVIPAVTSPFFLRLSTGERVCVDGSASGQPEGAVRRCERRRAQDR